MKHNLSIRALKALLFTTLLTGYSHSQTPGSVNISATLSTYGHGQQHWVVIWVTKSSGEFVRTIRRQGNEGAYDSHWGDHCTTWYDAVNGIASRYTVAPDGFTGATASSYTAPNNPVTQTWDCKDDSGTVVPDGDYKLWIQYSEDDESDQGPVTSGGLLWTKGATASTITPPDQGSQFTKMSIKWTPGGGTSGKPEIVVMQPVGSSLKDGKTTKSFGTVPLGKSRSKTFTIKNDGKAKLKGLNITLDGTAAKDFVVGQPAKTTLTPGATTTFKVTFKPKTKGTRTAAFHLKSNDADENPFDVKLTGQGVK